MIQKGICEDSGPEASGVIWTVTDDSVKKSECFLKGFCKNAYESGRILIILEGIKQHSVRILRELWEASGRIWKDSGDSVRIL